MWTSRIIQTLKKDATHNFWTDFGDSDCSGAGSEPCQGSKRFEAGTVHYCSFPSVRNTKLPDEPGKSTTLLPSRCTEVHFASLLSGGFPTIALINPPEKKMAKPTSVHCIRKTIKVG